MALTKKDYIKIADCRGLYAVSEMDKDFNTRTQLAYPGYASHNVYSVAKMFTATAIGICRDRGMLKLEDKFVDIMDIALPEGTDPKWKNVTVHMLMKHQVGFEKRFLLDIDADNAAEYPSLDYLSLILSEPLPLEQGVDVTYTDAAFYLLSRVVEKLSGKTLCDFLRPVLMDTMRFKEYAWSACPYGHTMGGTGLYIRCEDMVKLGALYLNGGMWKGTRVFSDEWSDLVFERQYEFHRQGESEWFAKLGMYDQILAVSLNRGLAVSWQSSPQGGPGADILCVEG